MTAIKRNSCLPFIEIKEGQGTRFSIRKHSHEELSIGFVENGSSRITCESLKFELNVNHAILLPPGAIHLCTPEDENSFKFLMVYINLEWFFSVFGFHAALLTPESMALDKDQVMGKTHFFEQFMALDDPLTAESEASLFIGRLIFDVFKMSAPEPAPDKEHTEINIVKDFLDRHYGEPIQLDQLALLYGKSKFSLLREFKKSFQMTPHAYLLNKRINEAKQMLLKDKSIARTAVDCGFFDQSHFIKTFRQYVGMNPADYKSV